MHRFLNSNSGKHSAFTLVEVIVAITILSFIMVSVFGIYSQILGFTKRLSATRVMQANARSIVEKIATDVRTGGIAFECYDTATCGEPFDRNYSASGATALVLRQWADLVVYRMKKPTLTTGYTPCAETEVAQWLCTLVHETRSGTSLTEEVVNNDLVRLDALRFFLSGVNVDTHALWSDEEGKVTIVFSIEPSAKSWADATVAKEVRLNIQTTVTEKLYKTR